MQHYTVAGIGAGPANLSFAALSEGRIPGGVALFEGRPGPAWHPGLLHPGTQLQTSWIKDLVSLADPCSRLSFLNYLVRTGRVYGFLNAQYTAIPRLEYARYLAWASEQLGVVHYGRAITRIGFDRDRFVLADDEGELATAGHLVLGLGTRAHIPDCFERAGLDTVVLAEDLEAALTTAPLAPYEQMIVVGGGQTGAECVLHLLGRGFRDIRWIGRRHWFAPLDDSPPANDFYRPSYLKYFQGLPSETRERHTSAQVLTSDGVSMETLQELYRANYETLLRDGRAPVMMLPGRTVAGAESRHGMTTLWCERDGGGRERHTARLVADRADGHRRGRRAGAGSRLFDPLEARPAEPDLRAEPGKAEPWPRGPQPQPALRARRRDRQLAAGPRRVRHPRRARVHGLGLTGVP